MIISGVGYTAQTYYIDAADADGLLVDSCLVHHFLAGSFTQQTDAHGIVATDTQGLIIRNTEIHHVSGDSFQAEINLT